MLTRPRTVDWFLLLLLTVCIGRLWIVPLASSFWTDEMGTVFIVQHPTDASIAPVSVLLPSIYWNLPRISENFFGFSEVSYRLPSILMMALALFVTGRLASRAIYPAAAWFAVFACLAIGDLNYYAIDAKPYALGICIACLTIWFLISWLDTATWKSAALFILLAALLWRVQLVFWAFYPVYLIYTLARAKALSWSRAFIVYIILALALLPVALQALANLHTAQAHSFAPLPTVGGLLKDISWQMILLWGASALVASKLFKWPFQKPRSTSDLILIAAWWLWMPLCFFVFSHLTGTVLFVKRYFSLTLPGVALAVTALVALYLPRNYWKHAAALMGLWALIAGGHWRALNFDHTHENWRQASQTVRLWTTENTPILAISPFIEAQPPVWTPDYKLPGFLYAPLYVYPVRGHVYPFPYATSPDTEAYAARLLDQTLLNTDKFIVYGVGKPTADWIRWFSARPELANWGPGLHNADVVSVAVFKRP